MAFMVYLSLGSNVGERSSNIKKALQELENLHDVELISCSALYETAPEGYADQPDFINAAVHIKTDLGAEALLKETQSIEKKLGRIKNFHWGPRVIDIDILFYGDEVISTENLQIPHPRMHERAFVLLPLAEIAPDAVHPVTGERIDEMSEALPPLGGIKKMELSIDDIKI